MKRLDPPGRRLLPVLAGIALVLGLGLVVFWNLALFQLMLSLRLNDLGKFYFDARLYLAGEPMYGPNPATEFLFPGDRVVQFLNLSPPPLQLVVLPLGFVGPSAAALLWLGTGMVCLAASLWVTVREVGLRLTRLGWTTLALVVLASAGVGGIFLTGQLTFHFVPLFTWAWIAARRRQAARLGVAWGLLCAFKPFFLVFAPWLLWRRPRALVVGLLAAGAAFVVAFLVFGAGTFEHWLAAMRAIDWHHQPLNASWRGLVERTFGAPWLYAPLVSAPALARTLSLAGFALLGTLALLVVLADQASGAADRAFVILLLAALLMSPLGWIYYLPLALCPALALLAAPPARPSRGWVTILLLGSGLALTTIPTFGLTLGQPAPGLTPTLGSAHFWGVLALFLAAVSRVPGPVAPGGGQGIRSWLIAALKPSFGPGGAGILE